VSHYLNHCLFVVCFVGGSKDIPFFRFPPDFFFYARWTEYYVFLLPDDIFSSIFGKMSFIFGQSLAEVLPDVEFVVMIRMDCI